MDFTKMYDPNRVGIANHAKDQPDKPALIMNDRAVTFRQLHEDTNALSNALLGLGIGPGDRISVMFHNSPEILKAWTAAGKISVTPIALNYRFKADELSYIINDSESKALIYGSEFEDVVQAAASKFANPEVRLIRHGGPVPSGVLDFDEIIANASNAPPETQTGAHGVASSLIYTSGTTGRPKGVVRGSKNRLNSLLGYAYTFETTYDDTHMVAGPLYHSAPYAWAAFSLILGNTVVIMPRFDAEDFLRQIEKHKVTTAWAVPTMLNRILNLPDEIRDAYDISSLRVMTVGGESFPFPLKQRSVEFFGPNIIFEFFGATEISCVTYMRPEEQMKKPGSCGKPAMGNDIRLLDENMQEAPTGEVGVMYVKSPFLLDGYYNNPEATQANYHEGYFTVGDMARVDEDGYYYIVDRAVDMIISGGVNIYPAEIEELLYTHPKVFDAGIVGIPDPDWGERIVAFVVPREGADVSEEEIIGFVAENLASYKKPKEVYFVEKISLIPRPAKCSSGC
ncbi:MAG: AMP-binding protein [Deltaproteobacteria bacterium]|nr:AMP-binding protein [Deltaproteobacteria bacterium]